MAIERGEDGYYVADVIELPGCHTQAKTLKELDARVKEAIELNLEAGGKDLHIPEVVVVKKIPRLSKNRKQLHPAKARDVVKALNRLGFLPRHSKGSHVLMKHQDGRTTTVPIHPREEIDQVLLRKIAADVGMESEELMFLIDEA